MEKKKNYRALIVIPKHNHNRGDKNAKTPMGRSCPEESKLIN